MEIALRVGRRRFAQTWPVPATPAAGAAPHAAFDPRRIRGGAAALEFWVAFVRHLAPRVRVTEWAMDVTVGTADAALTALVAGALAAAVGMKTAALGHRLRCVPRWRIVPRWEAEHFVVEGEASVGFEGRAADLVGAVFAVGAAAMRRVLRRGARVRAGRWHRGRPGTAH